MWSPITVIGRKVEPVKMVRRRAEPPSSRPMTPRKPMNSTTPRPRGLPASIRAIRSRSAFCFGVKRAIRRVQISNTGRKTRSLKERWSSSCSSGIGRSAKAARRSSIETSWAGIRTPTTINRSAPPVTKRISNGTSMFVLPSPFRYGYRLQVGVLQVIPRQSAQLYEKPATCNPSSHLDRRDLLHHKEAGDDHDRAADWHTNPGKGEHLFHIVRRDHEDDQTEDGRQRADDVAGNRLLRGQDADLALDADPLADGVPDHIQDL